MSAFSGRGCPAGGVPTTVCSREEKARALDGDCFDSGVVEDIRCRADCAGIPLETHAVGVLLPEDIVRARAYLACGGYAGLYINGIHLEDALPRLATIDIKSNCYT